MAFPRYHRSAVLARDHERFARQAVAAGASVMSTVTDAAVDTAPSTATASGSAPASSSSSCTYNGSVSTYASCERARISTTELVAGGFGVVVGVIILAAACVLGIKMWKRQRGTTTGSKANTSAGATDIPRRHAKADHGAGDDMGADYLEEDEADYAEDEGHARYEKKPFLVEKEGKNDEDNVTTKARSATVDSITDEEDVPARPPAPNDIRPAERRSQGSPVDSQSIRNLYPSNPSSPPKNWQAKAASRAPKHPPTPYAHADQSPASRSPARPPSALRAPQSHRQSMASVRFAAGTAPDDVPPLPVSTHRPPLASGTTFGTPLNVRKSTASTVGIPSYYETAARPGSTLYGEGSRMSEIIPAMPTERSIARGGRQGGGARRVSRVQQQGVGSKGASATAEGTEEAPPVPNFAESRPSAASASSDEAGGRSAPPRRPSEGRGGMI